MLSDVAHFLIETVGSVFGAILLLRAWMRAVRMPTYHPLSLGVFQVTDWLVSPLRRILPVRADIDWASLLGAYLTALLAMILVAAASSGDPLALFPMGFLIALLTTIKSALNLLLWTTLLMALLSWINPRSPAMPVLMQLTEPLLAPIRRIAPRIGGVDVSPMFLFVLIELLLIIVARLLVSVAFGTF